jgi:aryl-alcohol dehydrogenase-like predicted oxidoreductase
MNMKKRELGKSGIEVTPIGLGTWQFSKGKGLVGGFWKSIDEDATAEVVGAAREGGIDWFDTAEIYGRGNSERSLAAALSRLKVAPGSARIATKWWPFFRTAGSIPATIAERMECLSPYAIDLYQIHQPWSLSSVRAQIGAMGDLVKAGKIKAVGVSNFSAAAMEESCALLAARGIPLASNQVRISLLDRSIERNGLLEAAKRLGVTLIAYSPLAQGILTGRFHDDPEAMESVSRMRRMSGSIRPETLARTAPLVAELKRVAAAHKATASQVALNWLVRFWGDTVVAIPGASKPAQASEAALAMSFELTPTELASIDEISRRISAPLKKE